MNEPFVGKSGPVIFGVSTSTFIYLILKRGGRGGGGEEKGMGGDGKGKEE